PDETLFARPYERQRACRARFPVATTRSSLLYPRGSWAARGATARTPRAGDRRVPPPHHERPRFPPGAAVRAEGLQDPLHAFAARLRLVGPQPPRLLPHLLPRLLGLHPLRRAELSRLPAPRHRAVELLL